MEVDRDRAPRPRSRVVEGSLSPFWCRVEEYIGVCGWGSLAFGVWRLIFFLFFSGHVLRNFGMRGGPTADPVTYGAVEGMFFMIGNFLHGEC